MLQFPKGYKSQFRGSQRGTYITQSKPKDPFQTYTVQGSHQKSLLRDLQAMLALLQKAMDGQQDTDFFPVYRNF